jgi:hypothetical protein
MLKMARIQGDVRGEKLTERSAVLKRFWKKKYFLCESVRNLKNKIFAYLADIQTV